MSDDAALLNAVRANPDDEAARLVYADWLEERGDPRGEYMRLEVEAARAARRLRELRGQLPKDWRDAVSLPGLDHPLSDCLAGTLRLRGGRLIWLVELKQDLLYEGMIQGVPDAEHNDALIERALEQVPGPYQTRTHLLTPARRNYCQTPGDTERHNETRDTPAEFLPSVRCIARFHSKPFQPDPDWWVSALNVVWFHDELAPPIRQPVLDQLRNLDWDALAEDIEWF